MKNSLVIIITILGIVGAFAYFLERDTDTAPNQDKATDCSINDSTLNESCLDDKKEPINDKQVVILNNISDTVSDEGNAPLESTSAELSDSDVLDPDDFWSAPIFANQTEIRHLGVSMDPDEYFRRVDPDATIRHLGQPLDPDNLPENYKFNYGANKSGTKFLGEHLDPDEYLSNLSAKGGKSGHLGEPIDPDDYFKEK